MSVLGTVNTRNYSQKTNYQCGSESLGIVPFYVTELNLPGVTTNIQETSGRSGAVANFAPANMTYNPITLTVLLDEDYKIWEELMGNVNINVEDTTFLNKYFDFWIEAYNDMGHKKLKVEFYGCLIDSISDLTLGNSDDMTEQNFEATIRFDYFKIIKDEKIPTLRIK